MEESSKKPKTNGPVRLGYVILYVPSVEATLSFYEAAFGLSRQLLHKSGAYGELNTGSTSLAFVSESLRESNGVTAALNRPDGIAAGAEIALVVGSVAQAYDHAVGKGAIPLVSPKETPWGQTVAYVRDCNGFLVELCSKMAE